MTTPILEPHAGSSVARGAHVLRRGRSTVAALLLAGVTATPVAAQVTTVDEGSFTITRAGERVGREEFSLRRTPGEAGAVYVYRLFAGAYALEARLIADTAASFAFGAIATPTGDAISMLVLTIPIIALYFIAVGLTIRIDKRATKRAPKIDARQPASSSWKA